MQALILDKMTPRLDGHSLALLEAGMQVTGTGSLKVAATCMQLSVVDLLVLDKTTAGPKIGALIAMAEARNRKLVTLMLSADVARDMDLYGLRFSSLHAILSDDLSPGLTARMGLASLSGGAMDLGDDAPTLLAREQEQAPVLFRSARHGALEAA